MRRRYFRLGALLLMALPLAALAKCGYTARINVRPLYYNQTQFVSFARCAEDGAATASQNQVDILYSLIRADNKVIGKDDPLLPTGTNNGVRIELKDLEVAGQAGKTFTASVTGNEYVSIAQPGQKRAFAFLMDNSRSLNGFDESTGQRIPLTDPNDGRLAGAQNLVGNEQFTSSDRATIIAFQGEGIDGVDAKLSGGQPAGPTWFISSTETLKSTFSELRNEEDGKTPLYDAIGVGAEALRTLPGDVKPIIVLFSDGPNNSSDSSFDDAKGALTGTPNIPMFAVAVTSQLTDDGEQKLRDLTCATSPRGAVLLATGSTVSRRFDPLQYASTGYWRARVSLTPPTGGLPSGKYTVTGKMFADPSDSPRTCDAEAPRCPDTMECDTSRGTAGECFVRVSFNYTVP